jgi:hypothetical protein
LVEFSVFPNEKADNALSHRNSDDCIHRASGGQAQSFITLGLCPIDLKIKSTKPGRRPGS